VRRRLVGALSIELKLSTVLLNLHVALLLLNLALVSL
jgi:hypothetical protein